MAAFVRTHLVPPPPSTTTWIPPVSSYPSAAVSAVASSITARFAASSSSSSLMDTTTHHIVQSCCSYFDSTKIVSTLIAGISITALFAFTPKDVQATFEFPKTRVYLMRLYHVFTLASFMGSLTAITAAQLGSTSLLLLLTTTTTTLASKSNTVVNAYSFLRMHLNIEFLWTRWSFAMSLLTFLISTTFRMILEFGLFAPKRRRGLVMVVSTMASVLCGLASLMNTTSSSTAMLVVSSHRQELPGLWDMTKELVTILYHSIKVQQRLPPLQIAAVVFGSIALVSSTRFLFPGSIEYDQLMDTEGYL